MLPYVFCVISAVFLALSFPPFDFYVLIWVALVPLLFALEGQRPAKAFLSGLITGLFFFLPIFFWMATVTWPGMLTIVIYWTIFVGIFSLVLSGFSSAPLLTRLLVLPCLWVALEWIRTCLINELGWPGFLGHTQYKFLPLIQITDVTGVYGVTWLVVVVNILVKETLSGWRQRAKANWTAIASGWIGVIVLFSLVFSYGLFQIAQQVNKPDIKIAVIQPNITREMRVNPALVLSNLQKHFELTREAVKESPDLVIWPENSTLPGFLFSSYSGNAMKKFISQIDIPLLLGAPLAENKSFYNAALLFSRTGEEIGRYRKIYLLPWAEEVPFQKYLPFLSRFFIGKFILNPGKEDTIFSFLPNNPRVGEVKFSVFICIEDGILSLGRRFVNKGANFLVNISNDGGFHMKQASLAHLQGAVFQAVANRRDLVRVSNTGISCFVDTTGRVYDSVRDDHGDQVFVEGHIVNYVTLRTQKSFYTRYGDVFVCLCMMAVGLAFILRMVVARK